MAPGNDESLTLFGRMRRYLRPGRRDSDPNSAHEKQSASSDGSSRKGIMDGSAEKSANDMTNSSSEETAAVSAHEDNLDRRRYMRIAPAWVSQSEQDVSTGPADAGRPFTDPQSPPVAHISSHGSRSAQPVQRTERAKGRRFDHARDASSVLAIPLENEDTEQLMAFMRQTKAPPEPQERGQVMPPEWLKENLPDFDEPWRPGWLKAEEPPNKTFWLFSPEKRVQSLNHFKRILMRNPFVPLVARLTVLAFVLAALALGVNIYRESQQLNKSPSETAGTITSQDTSSDYICKQQASTYMAFIVDSFAVIYILYITWDEYFSKPLGLRRSRDKIRLLFLDMLFIVFSAANLSLAFNTLTDQQWACYSGNPSQPNDNNDEAARSTCVYSDELCRRQRGLCGVLIVAEIAWVLVFAVSIFRVVERIQR